MTPSRLALILALCVLAALPSTASATPLPGENGRIVMTRGSSAGDTESQLHLLPVISNTGGGPLSAPITSGAERHQHPTWSPDRTRIAYAAGPAGNLDIFIQDLTNPASTPVNITNTNGVNDDRPAWSPDGTRIAYESAVTAANTQRDVLVQTAPFGGSPTNFTNTLNAGEFEGKPAWTPDSEVILYELGNPSAVTNANLMRKPATGGTATVAVVDSGQSEFQPAVSPDGSKVCYTHSTNGFNNSADVRIAPLTVPASTGTTVSKEAAIGEYNCTFSPDNGFVAYAQGTFTAGKLVMVRSDFTSPSAVELAQDAGSDNFDGNPDWAPDGRPECPDTNANTVAGRPVTITVECTDTGPQYERTNVLESNTGPGPANGTLTQDLAGDPFVYTPKPGFIGTDVFEVRSFDDFGFGGDTGTVRIAVQPGPVNPIAKCNSRRATIVGTNGNDTIVGTNRRDVIVARGGNDKILGKRGNDIICGNGGRDTIAGNVGNDIGLGGPGKDSLGGARGRDRMLGNKGNDTITGSSSRDVLRGDSGRDYIKGGSGNDGLGGGTGRDRLFGQSGRDSLNGGAARDRCNGGRGRDRGRRCEIRTSIP